MIPDEGLTYAAAGVDVEVKQRLLGRVRGLIEATHGPEVAAGVGPFAGLYRLPSGGHLAASADGVGTKIKLAIAAGRHRGIGVDIVNHCLNDIGTARARPLFFLDYFACGSLEEPVFGEVLEGLSAACGDAGCALLGGETAEMPGMYSLGDYDLAGFAVGLVEEDRVPDPGRVREGDVLVGLPSSGLHTNGYSLARRVFEDVPLTEPGPGEDRKPLVDVLLEPHRSYLRELAGLDWKTAAHITGGGFLENVPRALPDGLAARIHPAAGQVPPVFLEIQRRARIDDQEMRATFNLGIGMVLVCEQPQPGYPVIGEVVRQDGPRRVVFE